MISRLGEVLLITLAAMFAFLAGWTFAPGVPDSAGVFPLAGGDKSALEALGPVGETALGYRQALAARWDEALDGWCPPEIGAQKPSEGEDTEEGAAPLGQRIRRSLCGVVR